MKVGVVGLGRGRALATAFLAHSQVDEVMVVDPDDSRTAPEGTMRSPSVTDLLRAAPDLFVIATPPSSHTELTSFALEHGVPVLCETPIVTTVDELAALATRMKGTPPVLMSEDYLWLDWVDRVRTDGPTDIGFATAHYLEDARRLFTGGAFNRGWRASFDPFLYQTHLLAPILNLTCDRVVSARGFRGNTTAGQTGIRHAVFETAKSALITVTTGFSVAYPYGFGIELVGDSGSWKLDGSAGVSLSHQGGRGWRTTADESLSDEGADRRLDRLVAHVVEHARNGRLAESVLSTDWISWIAPGLAAAASYARGGAPVTVTAPS